MMRTRSARFAADRACSERPSLTEPAESSATRSATRSGGFSTLAGSMRWTVSKDSPGQCLAIKNDQYWAISSLCHRFLADQLADLHGVRGFASRSHPCDRKGPTIVAEGEGFEPPEPFPVQWFSRPPPSTTRPSLRGAVPVRSWRSIGAGPRSPVSRVTVLATRVEANHPPL